MAYTFRKYFRGLFSGLWSLLVGMATTIKVFFRKKTTEEYPNNRDSVYISPRYRGCLSLKMDESGKNKCIACSLCQNSCPNGSIEIKSVQTTNEEGKTTKVLDFYIYNLGSCMFCQICTRVCPTGAIEFSPEYENSVFRKEKLIKCLNKKNLDANKES